jgi:formamidopyrimidine-DNA glycosylase
MPELPEVETSRTIIERELTGRSVVGVVVRLPKLLRFSPIPTLEPLVGRHIVGARRRAKILIVDFNSDLSLVIHLKLAGQIAVHHRDGTRHTAGHPVPSPLGQYPHKSTHVELTFDSGTVLYVSDVRQFGWLRLLPTGDVEALIASFKFGPDAIGDGGFSAGDLKTRLARRSVPIKLALLNQEVVGGIGNIYVDEALHRARIHPSLPARELTSAQVEALFDAIQWSLERGVEQGGAKIIHGKAYPVDGFPAVHGREGKPCPACGTTILKIRVGARGTYLCPYCQPTSRSRPTDGSQTPA